MRTILIVEDDDAVRTVLRQMLASKAYRVLEADCASGGLDAAAAHEGPIDLLITDVVMPRSNCDQFVDQLVRQRPELKVIYISGYTAEVLERHGVDRFGTNFIQKPFTMDRLLERVRQVLGESEYKVRSVGC